MHNFLFKLSSKSLTDLKLWIVLTAILIAAQVQYIQHGWINQDSVLYLEAAKLFSSGKWQAGFEIFPWPFYALCIALVNSIADLGVHVTAQVLNVLFFGIATYSFISIIQLAGGKQEQIIAGALIWLSSQYMIGGVLEMLMRDEGFWAFFLLSVMFFIRFYQNHQIKYALLWQVCIMLATLFRIEAIIYLMFLPLVLFFQSEVHSKQRWLNALMANAINISLAIMIITVFTLNDNLSTKLLGRLNEVFTSNLWQQFTQQLTNKSSIMSSQVLGESLEEFAVEGLLLTFIYVIFVKTISATGFVNVILSIFAIKANKQLIHATAYMVLRATAIIALINMALIITKVFVLTGRYVLALSFILMIFAAFYFAKLLFTESKNKKLKWLSIILVMFMLGGTIKNVLPKKRGYNYMQDAVAWLSNYNQENKPVFYDHARMRYYANAPYIGNINSHIDNITNSISDKSIYHYHFIMIENSNKDNIPKSIIHHKLPEYTLINQFNDSKAKKSVIIYEKN